MATKLIQLAEDFMRMAGENLARDGHLAPVFLGLEARLVEGGTIAIPCSWDSDDDKDRAALAVKIVLSLCRAQRCVHVSEVWTTGPLKPGEWDGRRPSERDDRIEAVFVSVEDREGGHAMLAREILRDAGGNPRLAEVDLHRDDGSDGVEGRFAGMLDVPDLPPRFWPVARDLLRLMAVDPSSWTRH